MATCAINLAISYMADDFPMGVIVLVGSFPGNRGNCPTGVVAPCSG